MKKNFLKATLVAAFALVAGYNVYSSQKVNGVSDLALANVEALACTEVSRDTGYQVYGAENGCYCLACSEQGATNCNCW